MGHVGKECTLCPVGSFRSADCLIKGLVHFLINGTVRHNQDIFLFSVYLTAHCNNMKPALFPCFLVNIFKIPFLLLIYLDLFQIILLWIFTIFGMQFSQDANILLDLFYCNAQQFFHIGTYIICLICFCIQHQKNVIYTHGQLLKQLIPIEDLNIPSFQAYPVLLEDQFNNKDSKTEHYGSSKEHSPKLQGIHAGIDYISLDKSQKYPVLAFRASINQIVITSIQIYQHRICTSLFKFL